MSTETNSVCLTLTVGAMLDKKFTVSVPGHFQNALMETGGKCQVLAPRSPRWHAPTKLNVCMLPECKKTCQDRYSKSKQKHSEVEKPSLTPNTLSQLVVLKCADSSIHLNVVYVHRRVSSTFFSSYSLWNAS